MNMLGVECLPIGFHVLLHLQDEAHVANKELPVTRATRKDMFQVTEVGYECVNDLIGLRNDDSYPNNEENSTSCSPVIAKIFPPSLFWGFS